MAFRPSASLLPPLRLPVASSSRTLLRPTTVAAAATACPASTSRIGRRTTYSMVLDPKKDVIVDGKLANPLSAFEYDPKPPYAPLFPVYVPLTSLDPAVSPSVAEQSLVPLPRDIFGLPLRRDVLHACIVHHANLLKRGTTHTKNRAEVRGSGRKLHRQKGTGRARVADSGSGTRRGGGKRHGPRGDRDFSTELTRKTRQLGFKTALSQKLREGRLKVVGPDGFVLDGWPGAGKTAHVAKQLDALDLHRPLLLHSPWSPPPAEGLPRALRSNGSATIASVSSVSVLDILRSHDVVLDLNALEWLVGKVRQWTQLQQDATFDGNAMVMRRRKLGLTDFPAEGEADESKELLRALELEAGLRTPADEAAAEREAGLFGADDAVFAETDEAAAEVEVADAERIAHELSDEAPRQ